MNRHVDADGVLSLAEEARRIRDACPILGGFATDADCTARRERIGQVLTERGITPAAHHVWFTAQTTTGQVRGCWAHSVEEAELEISVWFGTDCLWAVEDNDLRQWGEYFPHGRPAQDRTFPAGPPRRVRDQVAPAGPLLDGLHADALPGRAC